MRSMSDDSESEFDDKPISRLKKSHPSKKRKPTKTATSDDDSDGDFKGQTPDVITSSSSSVKKMNNKKRVKVEEDDDFKSKKKVKKASAVVKIERKSNISQPAVPKILKKMEKADRITHAMQAFLWWDAPDPPKGCQWTTMEHAGVSFTDPYVPHGVKMLYEGTPVDLNPVEEEA